MGNPVSAGYNITEDIEFDLDIDKIVRGVKDWELCIEAVEIGTQNGIEELSERIRLKMIENLVEFGLGDSEIVNSISIIPYDNGCVISVGTDYAVYVEYGTGYVGSSNPHPMPDAWQYDVNSHGAEGWWYPTTSEDPNPKKRYDTNTGTYFGWTAGQPSRPFMYNAWLWARRSATQIIRKNIASEIRKCKGVR